MVTSGCGKWEIWYKGKMVKQCSSKKKTYSLHTKLSYCLLGLKIARATGGEKRNATADRAEYYRRWRARNKHKVRMYNQKAQLKRRQAETAGSSHLRIALNDQDTVAMATDYILFQLLVRRELPPKGFVAAATAAAGSGLAAAIARSYGFRVSEAPTESNDPHNFLLAFDENDTLVLGEAAANCISGVLDAGELLTRMAAYYADKGLSRDDVLSALYEAYGYYKEDKLSLPYRVDLPADGAANKWTSSVAWRVKRIRTGGTRERLHYSTEDGSWFTVCLGENGTTLELRFGAVDRRSEAQAWRKLRHIQAEAMIISRILNV